MASGLVALLDDVAGITKLAAASLDDVAGATAKAGGKAAGVVVDDAAVTPRYVTGFTPDRELPIIGRIALGSARNKLLILLPAALLLSAFAPWAITPLLMLGGGFLCYEAAEKVIEAVAGHGDGAAEAATGDPAAIEKAKVSGAIRTDLILSAEIMAIALADVADRGLVQQGIILAIVGLVITAAVYGAVGLIVKMDDAGLWLAQRRSRPAQVVGRGLVKGMPKLMAALSVIGTAAMAWVGGGIIVHGLEVFRLDGLPRLIRAAAERAGQAGPAALAGAAEWTATAALSGLVGLAIGGAIVGVIQLVRRRR